MAGDGTKICSYYCSGVCDAVASCSADASFAAGTKISLSARSTLLSKISSLLSSWGRSFSSPSAPAAAAKAIASDWNAINTSVGGSFTYNSISTTANLGYCYSFDPATGCSGVSRPAGTVDITMSSVSSGNLIAGSASNITVYANKLNSAPRCNTYSGTKIFNTACSGYCSCDCYSDCATCECLGDCATCNDCATCGDCPTMCGAGCSSI